jgi:hypothetical protein
VPENPGIFGGDYVWTGVGEKRWAAEVRSSLPVRSPSSYLAAIGKAVWARNLSDQEIDEMVLVVPDEPTVPDYEKVAKEAGVRIAWPDVFDERLAEALPPSQEQASS